MTDDWYGPQTATFGDRVHAAREAAGMSKEQLAKRLGIKKSTLRDWEDDLAEPRANKLQMLSGLLGVSITWLLTGEGDGVSPPEEGDVTVSDMSDVLLELREMQATLKKQADRIGRLEKRLRKQMEEPA